MPEPARRSSRISALEHPVAVDARGHGSTDGAGRGGGDGGEEVDCFGGDLLSGHDVGHSRRVGGQRVRGDPAHGLGGGHDLGGREVASRGRTRTGPGAGSSGKSVCARPVLGWAWPSSDSMTPMRVAKTESTSGVLPAPMTATSVVSVDISK